MTLTLPELRDAEKARSGGRCRWPGCNKPGEHLAHMRHRGMGGSESMNRAPNVAWLCAWQGRSHHQKLDGEIPMVPWDLECLLHDTILSFGFVKIDRCSWPGCFHPAVASRRTSSDAAFPDRPWCDEHYEAVDVAATVPGRKRMIAGLLRLVVATVPDVLDAAERLWPWTRDELLMLDGHSRGIEDIVDDRRVLTLVVSKVNGVRLGDLVSDWFGHTPEGFRKLRGDAQIALETDLAIQRAVVELVAEVAGGGVDYVAKG